MDRENENLSERRPEISAVEAALAQLRPRREARFADEEKNRMNDALSDKTPAAEEMTAKVKIPLTHYIRIAQFNAAAGGLFVGILLGVLLGGSGVYFALSRSETEHSQPMQSSNAVRSQYIQMLLKNDSSLAPLEQALLSALDKEPSRGR